MQTLLEHLLIYYMYIFETKKEPPYSLLKTRNYHINQIQMDNRMLLMTAITKKRPIHS